MEYSVGPQAYDRHRSWSVSKQQCLLFSRVGGYHLSARAAVQSELRKPTSFLLEVSECHSVLEKGKYVALKVKQGNGKKNLLNLQTCTCLHGLTLTEKNKTCSKQICPGIQGWTYK